MSIVVDFSYTYSKSLDLGSDTERTNSQGTTSTVTPVGQGVSTVLSYIANPWNPGLNRAPSDFDLRHVITADWVYELPFGKGKRFGLPPVPYWEPQFSSLFAWSSLGTSSYNAGQLMLRHPMSHGLPAQEAGSTPLSEAGSSPA